MTTAPGANEIPEPLYSRGSGGRRGCDEVIKKLPSAYQYRSGRGRGFSWTRKNASRAFNSAAWHNTISSQVSGGAPAPRKCFLSLSAQKFTL